jgi:hypothetical protein
MQRMGRHLHLGMSDACWGSLCTLVMSKVIAWHEVGKSNGWHGSLLHLQATFCSVGVLHGHISVGWIHCLLAFRMIGTD